MKRAAIVLLGLILATAAAWGIVKYGPRLSLYARVRWRAIKDSRREPASLAAWKKQFGDPAALPAHGDNVTALRLVQLAPGAGVTLKTSNGPSAAVTPVSYYVNAESGKTGGPIDSPPDVAKSYLSQHKPGLDAIVELLADAEPSWKTDDWPNPPSVSLSALWALNQILLSEALARASIGQNADAERAFLAAWNLNASLSDRTSMVEQLIAARSTSTQATLARRLPLDPVSWRPRMREPDCNASLLRAIVVESTRKFSADTSQMDRAARADYLDLMRANLMLLRNLSVTGPVQGTINPDDAEMEGQSAGAIVAEIARPGLEGAWISMDVVMLQLELTDRVLEARQMKAELGRWPATIPGLETSRITGVHWVYHVGPDGHMSIAISPELRGIDPPLRFESPK